MVTAGNVELIAVKIHAQDFSQRENVVLEGAPKVFIP